jgi:drug/metabolite transporter (DMT)-like permease
VRTLALSPVFKSNRAIHWTASFAGAALAFAGSALTTLIWFWALQKWNAGTLSLYLFLVPVLGIAIAVAIYGESIRFADVAGILLTLIAMAVALFERSNGIEGKDERPFGHNLEKRQ